MTNTATSSTSRSSPCDKLACSQVEAGGCSISRYPARNSKFNGEVIAFLEATGLKPKRTSVQAPWQNGIAVRWVGSCRCEILDHIIALNEKHLRRLMRNYVHYYHADRVHDSLDKDTPNRRGVERRPSGVAAIESEARLGGLHHRYSWRKAA